MIKINYLATINDELEEYYSIFKFSEDLEKSYNEFIKKNKFKLTKFSRTSLKNIILCSFEDLIEIYFELKKIKLTDNEKYDLQKIFDYDSFQSQISMFFMLKEKVINLATCYYCNIDYINNFRDLKDFPNVIDFIKFGTEKDFNKIVGIGKKTTQIILKNRNNLKTEKDLKKLKINSQQIENLKNFKLNKEYNHFTLDHIVDKGDFPLFSLSIYNFVPSCFSCNSKFKKVRKLFQNKNDVLLSPTSKYFSFNEDVKFIFKLVNCIKNIDDIKSHEDFILELVYRNPIYRKYINTFKLDGRYKFHKNSVFDLISLSQTYSPSRIIEISELVGKTTTEVKKDIFGEEIYESNLEKKPLSKLKKDIAQILNLI